MLTKDLSLNVDQSFLFYASPTRLICNTLAPALRSSQLLGF